MSFKIRITSATRSGRVGFLPRLHGRSIWSPEATADPRTFKSVAAADAYIKRNWETHSFTFSRHNVDVIEVRPPVDHALVLRNRATQLEKIGGNLGAAAADLRRAAEEIEINKELIEKSAA